MSRHPASAPAVAGEEGFIDCAGGVRLFYRAAGSGELMILLHGFPDDHRTWRPILTPLAERYRVVTFDLRGYSRSDKPPGVASYRMEKLVADAICLIDFFQRDKAILIGHDWGSAIAQAVAMRHPRRVQRLVLLNMPHLNAVRRELAGNRRQQAASWYARLFQELMIDGPFDWQILIRQLRARGPSRARSRAQPPARHTLDVLRRSDVTALMNYYRANYPRPPYHFDGIGLPRERIRVPTLIVFGVDDPYVLVDCARDNEPWFDAPLKVMTIEGAGHWVHHDRPEIVSRGILTWLGA